MKIIKLEDFKAEAIKRFGPDPKKWKFVCPLCHTPQSAEDLVAAGVPKDEVENYIGFSCIGRWTGASSALGKRKKKNKGCDWTLGGFLQLHEIEIEDEEGKRHPRFNLASIGGGEGREER